MAEAVDLKSAQCGFESHLRHMMECNRCGTPINCQLRDNCKTCGPVVLCDECNMLHQYEIKHEWAANDDSKG
jgi:hypothetical protein